MKLTIELVPRTCWYANVRSNVSIREWDYLRRESYKQAGYVCEICGGIGPTHPVECHEVWEYDDKVLTQTLIRLISLCPGCHEVKHIGLAQIKGNADRAIAHLMRVNDLSEPSANVVIQRAFNLWRKRSRYDWKLDIKWLTDKLDNEFNKTPIEKELPEIGDSLFED
jgi:hypothetical protein